MPQLWPIWRTDLVDAWATVRYGCWVGYCDLHSHILPGLDDGAKTPTDSRLMLQGLKSLGFDSFCATPHQKLGQFMPSHDAIRREFDLLLGLTSELGDVTFHLGAENMWDATLHERMVRDEVPRYDNGPAFLVEFPVAVMPMGVTQQFFTLRMKNRLPVVAHPERYNSIMTNVKLAEELGQHAAMVVDLPAVAGYHGKKEAKCARELLEKGLIHAAASDIHSPADVRSTAEGIEWIQKHMGTSAVNRLLDTAPRMILRGEHPDG